MEKERKGERKKDRQKLKWGERKKMDKNSVGWRENNAGMIEKRHVYVAEGREKEE